MSAFDHLSLSEEIAKKLGVDSDLVANLGLEVLQRCERTFDASMGSFKAYAKKALRYEFLRWKRQQERVVGIHENVIQQTDEKPLIDFDVSLLRSRLTDEEYQLLYAHYVDGKSMVLLSHEYGIDRTQVWKRLQKIRAKCRGD